MITSRSLPGQEAGVWIEWAHRRIGWAGWIGLALLVATSFLFGRASLDHRASVRTAAAQRPDPRAAAKPSAPMASSPVSRVTPALPGIDRMPLLLMLMKDAAVANGLEWRAADYRITPATPGRPASIDVNCSMKGSYPKLRAMLVQMLNTVPAFTLREINISRPNGETSDVDARLLMTVFVRDDAPTSSDRPSRTSQ